MYTVGQFHGRGSGATAPSRINGSDRVHAAAMGNPSATTRRAYSFIGAPILREERPLTPEVLTHWAETLSQPLFGQPFSCTLAQVPSRQEAMEQFEKEMRLMR